MSMGYISRKMQIKSNNEKERIQETIDCKKRKMGELVIRLVELEEKATFVSDDELNKYPDVCDDMFNS